MTPLKDVRVVMIGREPHAMGDHADGLAFSSSKVVNIIDDLPITLTNLFDELMRDQKSKKSPKNGSLKPWAQQGVLLINDVWTIRNNTPGSHKDLGWQGLTDEIIDTVYLQNPDAVFVFFEPCRPELHKRLPAGARVIKLQGPYPHTAYQGFFKSDVFTRINGALKATKQRPINWNLPT